MAVSKKSDPYFAEKPDQLAAVVETKGDPNKVGERAMAALYGAVYKLKFQLKKQGIDFKVGNLVARWPDAHTVPKDEWTGIWLLTVPPGTKELYQKFEDIPVRLENLRYGLVAEILHTGSYENETENINRLLRYIGDNGYEVAGVHEEEYLTKPTAKVPKAIIRYPVRKKDTV